MEPRKEYLSVLIKSILSRNLPGNIRRANYEKVISSSAAGLLPSVVVSLLVELERAGALFAADRCPYPSRAVKEVRDAFTVWQQEKGPGRREGKRGLQAAARSSRQQQRRRPRHQQRQHHQDLHIRLRQPTL